MTSKVSAEVVIRTFTTGWSVQSTSSVIEMSPPKATARS